MHIRQLLLICLALWPVGLAAQSTSPGDPNPAASSKKAPVPLNLDSLQKALVYPPIARKARIEGEVIMYVIIDESGRYSKHMLLTAPHFLLTEEAEKMVQYVRFEPAMRDGLAIPYLIKVPFDFKLPADSIDDPSGIDPIDVAMLQLEPIPLNLPEVKKLIGYPPMANKAEIEGKVVLRILVDEQGSYVKHILLEDPHSILSDAVIDKIPKLRFSPPTQGGKPIKAWVTIPVEFKLRAPNQMFYSVEEALAYQEPSLVKQLNLNGKGLKEFPMEILQFTELTVLELRDNQLTQIPAELQSLTQLTKLVLSQNQLTSLPAAVLDMPKLQAIHVQGNLFPGDYQKWLLKNYNYKLRPWNKKDKVIW